MLKEIRGNLIKWKAIPGSQTGKFNFVKDGNTPQIDLQIQHNPY